MQATYDAVVVGTGYGGSIAAARLASTGRSVCMLERGIERQPGDYPDSLVEGARSIRVETVHAEYGSPAALFDFHVGDDISVLVGSGLGGTSQINAGVALRPALLRASAMTAAIWAAMWSVTGAAGSPEVWSSSGAVTTNR